MQTGRHIVNLALIGFMGTGKTSVGRLVADHLHFEFIDTDELIQNHTGRTIADIFTNDGEAVFRDWERKIVRDLAPTQKKLVSTGGGLPAIPGILDHLKQHSLIVCLWATPDKIWERVSHQSHRPLLNDPDPRKKIRELLAAREPFYRQADVLVNTDVRSLRDVAQQVTHQFRFALSHRG